MEWDPNRTIHALLLVAHDDRGEMGRIRDRLLAALGKSVDPLGEELGEQLFGNSTAGNRIAIEHFGYADGISSPVFIKQDLPSNHATWNPLTAPKLVLEKCPGGSDLSYGSYVVFRKLEQDPREFTKLQDYLAEELCLKGGDRRDRAGALLIGRYASGKPLVSSAADDLQDFDYASDPRGGQCPFTAHTRKVNPRGASDEIGTAAFNKEQERRHIIARRGITYGTRPENDHLNPNANVSERPAGGVGLLFVCYQQSIETQFEHLQRRWAQDVFFPILRSRAQIGLDGLLGNGDFNVKLPSDCSSNEEREVSVRSCIRLRGGEYFFAPSKSFFHRLSV
jgi:Dyp-type peroxidase family